MEVQVQVTPVYSQCSLCSSPRSVHMVVLVGESCPSFLSACLHLNRPQAPLRSQSSALQLRVHRLRSWFSGSASLDEVCTKSHSSRNSLTKSNTNRTSPNRHNGSNVAPRTSYSQRTRDSRASSAPLAASFYAFAAISSR